MSDETVQSLLGPEETVDGLLGPREREDTVSGLLGPEPVPGWHRVDSFEDYPTLQPQRVKPEAVRDIRAIKELPPEVGNQGFEASEFGRADGMEPEARDTYEKTLQTGAAHVARLAQSTGITAERLLDIGPGQTLKGRFGEHEAAMIRSGAAQESYDQALREVGHEQLRKALMAPAGTFASKAGEAAAMSEAAAAATPGNEMVAKVGGAGIGMLPFLATGPLMPLAGGVVSYGGTYEQAFKYYTDQGVPEEQAKALADKDAMRAGLISAGVFKAVPGLLKSATGRVLGGWLASETTPPVVRWALNTAAGSAEGGAVMGADSLMRNADAKMSYRPELTAQEALVEAAKEFGSGALGTALIHGPAEAIAELRGAGKPAEPPSEVRRSTELDRVNERLDEIEKEWGPREEFNVEQRRMEPVREPNPEEERLLERRDKLVELQQEQQQADIERGLRVQQGVSPDRGLPEGIELPAGGLPGQTTGDEYAKQDMETTQPDGTVQQPEGTSESAREMPTDEGGQGVPAGGPGQEVPPGARGEKVDPIEDWLNRAIEATKPGTGWTGEASLGVAKVPVWLAKEAAHGSLRIVRATYKTGKDIAAAMRDGVEYLRGLNLRGFNEEQARQWLRDSVEVPASHSRPTPEKVDDYVTRGAVAMMKGGTFDEWKAALQKELGHDEFERARQWLPEIYQRAGDALAEIANTRRVAPEIAAMRPAERADLPLRTGTRNPNQTAQDPFREDAAKHPTVIGMETMLRNPNVVEKAGVLLRKYYKQVLVGKGKLTDEQAMNALKEHVVENLLWLYKQYTPEIRARAKLWYDGARRITEQWEKHYGITRQTASTVIALLSPQRDWYQNVSQARRTLDIVLGGHKRGWTPEMTAKVKEWLARKGQKAMSEETKAELVQNLPTMQKTPWGKLDNYWQKGLFVRAMDEAHNDSRFKVLAPEGHEMGWMMKDDGTPEKITWPPFDTLGRAVAAIENPSRTNFSRLLGMEHKIRNFANNILLPNDPRYGDVTIDTHAVAAGLLKPLGGTTREVLHAFGKPGEVPKGKPSEPGPAGDAVLGQSGLYGIHADAYREAAKRVGLLPREMQSITWEAVRGLFTDVYKRNDNDVANIERIWQDVANGKKTVSKARGEILKAAGENGRIRNPTWYDPGIRSGLEPGGGASAEPRPAGDVGELSGARVPGAGPRAGPGRGPADAGESAKGIRTEVPLQEGLTPGDRVEAWLNRAIDVTRPGTGWTGEASLGVAKVPVWFARETATLTLQAVKAAYLTTRNLAEAIKAGVDYVRAQALPGFDERELHHWLSDTLAERETGLKIQESAKATDETKKAITEYLYERRSNRTDDQIAAGIVQQHGLDAAEQMLRSPPANMPGAVRSALLGEVTKRLTAQERSLPVGSPERQAAADKAGALWDDILPHITDLGQELQKLNDLALLSPDAQVSRTRRRLERAGNEQLNKHADELAQMQNALEQGRAAGVEAVRNDEQVNGAARAAVNEHVAKSEETRKAIIMDLAEPWSQSTHIVQMAREQVRSKAQQLLSKGHVPEGVSAGEHLRAIMDDLGQRAATIAAGYFQGASPHPDGLQGLLKERLGLDDAHAGRLAKNLDGEFQKQVNRAQAELPRRIRDARTAREAEDRALAAASKTVREAAVRRADAETAARTAEAEHQATLGQLEEARANGALAAAAKLTRAAAVRRAKAETAARTAEAAARTHEAEKARAEQIRKAGGLVNERTASTAAVDASIRKQLQLMNRRMGDVLRQEADRRDATGAHVAERVVEASGLKGTLADGLRNTLKNRWDNLVTRAQVRTLEALQKRNGVKVTRPYRSAFQKLVEMERMGALTSERFHDVVKQSLKLKRLSPADARELRRMVVHAQELPEGFMQQRAEAEILKFTERLAGNVTGKDIPMSIFYANVLSGLTTPAKIAFENTNLLVGQTLAQYLGRPGEWLHPVGYAKAVAGAYKRGIAKGALQAADTLRTGTVSGVWEKPKVPTLEMKFGRDVGQGPVARMAGRGFDAINFWKYFGRVIGTAHELTFKPAMEMQQTLTARDVARREGLKGKELDQRVAELLGNTEERFAAARAQALKEVQNGDRIDIARRTREIIEQGREETMPGSGDAARQFALKSSYLNEPEGLIGIVTRKAREALEMGRKTNPILGTAVKSQVPFLTIVGNILNEKVNWTPLALHRVQRVMSKGELYGRKVSPSEAGALYAKAILGTLALGAAYQYADHIHGNGPSDPKKRKQLLEAGWIPHSVEHNGKYVSYMNSPMALGLSVLGNLEDWKRYGKGDEADGLQRAAAALKGVGSAIISQGMLDGVKRLLEGFGNEDTTVGGTQIKRALAKTAGSFVFPNAAQQVDRLFDPNQYEQTGIRSLLQSQVPFVRREGKPVLNILGEPIQATPFHYWASQQSKDPVWRFIADKQIFIPAPNKAQVETFDSATGKMRAVTDDEYYQFVKESGPKIRNFIEKAMPQLEKMDPDIARRVVRAVAEDYHNIAKFTAPRTVAADEVERLREEAAH